MEALGLREAPTSPSSVGSTWVVSEPFAAADKPRIPFFQSWHETSKTWLDRRMQASRIGLVQGVPINFLSPDCGPIHSRITIFIGLLAHQATAMGAWLVKVGDLWHDVAVNTLRGCNIWDCLAAQLIYRKRVFRLMTKTAVQRIKTSGSALTRKKKATWPSAHRAAGRVGLSTLTSPPSHGVRRDAWWSAFWPLGSFGEPIVPGSLRAELCHLLRQFWSELHVSL